MNKLLKINCPQCEKVFYYYESEFRPFCCERCKMIDLGHWFEESYRVPSKEIVQSNQFNQLTKNINNEKSQNDFEELNFGHRVVDIFESFFEKKCRVKKELLVNYIFDKAWRI